MSGQTIRVPDDKYAWHTRIPNILDTMNLDPYEFRLLVHYYRVGNCWESTKTTATNCNMSAGQVSQKRQSLAVKGLIVIDSDKKDSLTITVVDIWAKNYSAFMSRKERSHDEQERSPHETKNNPVKNNPVKKLNTLDSHEASCKNAAKEKFESLTRIPIPKNAKEAGVLWWNPIREICEMCEWDSRKIDEVITKSIARLREGKLTIASPKSILKTSRAIFGELSGGAKKYNAEEMRRASLEAVRKADEMQA